ncbi:hypothetical protein CVIRNUC_008577, partial [Coccomyxa viridis]
LPARGSYCPITVSYEVSLGQAPLATATETGTTDDFTDIPIFFGKIGIFSNNATIASWRLGWNFTAKETIQSASNVYTPGVDVLALDPPNVQLQSSNVNLTIKPFSWTEISFLGTKSTAPVPDAQYKVAPVDGVAFNNLVCTRLPIQAPSEAPSPSPSTSQEYIAVPATDNASTPAPLYIEYAPVVYLHNQQSSSSDEWQSDINSLITFLVRLANVASNESISSGSVAFQYWFNGPMDVPEGADPLSQLTMDCLDATTGCGDLTYNITTGLSNVAGAKYVLNAGFKPGAFVFVSVTESDMSTSKNNVSLQPPEISIYEALLRIESRQFLREMNATQDYSYLDTPRSSAPISNTTNIVPRLAEANGRIPAYVDMLPAWGSKPVAGLPRSLPPSPAPTSGASSGVTCAGGAQSNASATPSVGKTSFGQVCGLSAIYCCYTVSNEPVSTQIPSQWPPYNIPLPAGLDKASLDCASGNCTESALGPASQPSPLPEGSLQPGSPLHSRAPAELSGYPETPAPGPAALSLYSQEHASAHHPGLGHGATAGIAVAGAVAAALIAAIGLICCQRRRSVSRYLPGSPQAKPSMAGLPTTLRPPVYKQGSTDSQMPFLSHQGSWLNSLLPWRKRKRSVEFVEVGPAGSNSAVAVEGAVALASPRMISQQRPSTAPARASSDGEPLAEGGFPEGLELMPQDLRSLRAKQRPVQLGRLPGAAHLRAAGQLPQRLLINHNADRDAAAAAGALQSVVPMWQGEAAHRQIYARGDVLASPRKSVPHGYIAQSASDLMLFTNPLIQDTLPPDWENRVRNAMASQLAGKNASAAPAQTSNLISEFLGRARTPRWLGDPYGVDREGAMLMGPERVSLPNIAAKSRHEVARGSLPGARRLAQTVPHLSSSDSSLMSLDWAAEGGSEQAKPGLRRVRSWAGEVRADNSSACHDQRAVRARHLHRLSASSASLPPLAVLPPPISMGVPPPANIDLDVNFEAEIKPHLHACLGQGGFGSVFEAQWRGKPVAVKVLLGPEMGSRTVHFDALRREVQLAARFNSERLVQARSSGSPYSHPLPLHHGDDWNLAIPRILTNIKGSGSLSTRSTGRLGMSAKTL